MFGLQRGAWNEAAEPLLDAAVAEASADTVPALQEQAAAEPPRAAEPSLREQGVRSRCLRRLRARG